MRICGCFSVMDGEVEEGSRVKEGRWRWLKGQWEKERCRPGLRDGWSGGERKKKKKKKGASIPLTSSDVMLMQICPAGCERRRGGERDAEKESKLLSVHFSHPSAEEAADH